MRLPLAAALIALAACGGGGSSATDDAPATDAPATDIAAQLSALPGVTVTERSSTQIPSGDRYFVLQVTQPVDHDDPNSATFQQEVSLIHKDTTSPMVLFTTGYDDYNKDFPSEPMLVLEGNQISVEHRFFGTSRPDPADWSKLTIKQMADDEHAIVQLLKPIYQGAWVSTGGSKGGMTASYHHRFYPADVAGTLAYVAPMSFSVPDERYGTFLAATGTSPCAANVRAVAVELENRYANMLALAQSQATAMSYAYNRVPIGPAVESAITDLEWTFWQYDGVSYCDMVPATTATDAAMFDFLDGVSEIHFSDDDGVSEFEAYFYQAYAELGSPGPVSVRGDLYTSTFPALQFGEASYAGWFPVGVAQPTFDSTAMADIHTWITTEGSHFVFEYGQYDPWTGGAYDLGSASDAIEVTSPAGTHDDGLFALDATDEAAALAKLQEWTGVTPITPSSPRPPRPPGLRTRRLPL